MGDYRQLGVCRRLGEGPSAGAAFSYQETQQFPTDEQFESISQIQRRAASIPSNTAEGSGRGSDQNFARFARITAGSINELECQCIPARSRLSPGAECYATYAVMYRSTGHMHVRLIATLTKPVVRLNLNSHSFRCRWKVLRGTPLNFASLRLAYDQIAIDRAITTGKSTLTIIHMGMLFVPSIPPAHRAPPAVRVDDAINAARPRIAVCSSFLEAFGAIFV